MNKLMETKIENLIYEIRGRQVMLDSDLAILYQCKNGTKEINQAVKNNIKKFPERFSWILTEKEFYDLRSKFLTSSLNNNYGGRRYLPRVFTEEGVAMLSTILKSKTATEVSIRIMDTFVSMRKFINENKDIFKRITSMEYKLLEHDSKIDELFDKLEPKKIKSQKIFFNGEIYDSYSLIIDLISKANNRIIIIDNYIDKSILDMLIYKNKEVNVQLVTNINNLTKLDIEKFNKQYPKLTIKNSNIFHDRFIIIDDTLYHIGASLKDLGKKCFGINKIEDIEILTKIIEKTL